MAITWRIGRWAAAALACAATMCHAQGAGDAAGVHALIIGISNYAPQSRAAPLTGVPIDVLNARRMALAMGADARSIVELRDGEATKEGILRELKALHDRAQPGSRVLVFFSGHGTRMETAEGCQEGLSTYTGEMLTEAELARFTAPISQRAEKVLVMIDACFSGGVLRARSVIEGGLHAKFSEGASQCVPPVNVPTRSLLSEVTRLGAAQENFVQIAAANYNEVSWDNQRIGGLATHSVTQCLLGDATDLNHSGAVSLDEVRVCAQTKMNALMAPYRKDGLIASTLQVRGNRNLVVTPAPEAPAPPPDVPAATTKPPADTAVGDVPDSTLDDIFHQRDPRRMVEVKAPESLRIGRDAFAFTLKSSHDGYLYVLMLGSDKKSFHVLFPNRIDADNRIRANTAYEFPRREWRAMPAGPAGTDKLLFVVSQSPRALAGAGLQAEGDYMYAPTDFLSRRKLVAALLGRGAFRAGNSLGASLLTVQELD